MNIPKEKIREFIERKIDLEGKENTINFVKTSDYPKEIKEFCMGLLESKVPEQDSMAENGDISISEV